MTDMAAGAYARCVSRREHAVEHSHSFYGGEANKDKKEEESGVLISPLKAHPRQPPASH